MVESRLVRKLKSDAWCHHSVALKEEKVGRGRGSSSSAGSCLGHGDGYVGPHVDDILPIEPLELAAVRVGEVEYHCGMRLKGRRLFNLQPMDTRRRSTHQHGKRGQHS